MRLLASLPMEKSLQSSLDKKRISYKQWNDRLFVPLIKKGIIWHIPPIIYSEIAYIKTKGGSHDDPALVIELYESGGNVNGSPFGTATVVSGLSGKKLKPKYLSLNKPAGIHATFLVRWHAVVGSINDTGEMVLNKCFVERLPDKQAAAILYDEMWKGYESYIPPFISNYASVLMHLAEKAKCKKCMHIHYAEDPCL